MIKRLLTLHRPALFGLWTILCLISISAYAQTYELNVGDSRTLYAPDPPMGTLDIGEWSSSNSNVWVFGKGSRNESAEVKVANYFSGTATITCSVKYSWYDSSASTGNHYKTGYTSKTYYISAKPTEVKLSKTSLELEIGDEVELSYTTNPSGLEPEVEWRTTDPIVAKIEGEYNQGYRETISNEKKITVWAVSVGTCVIKLGCNTGYSAPTCSITVKDERPHITADVASGSVKKGTKVTLTCDITGADIRYTTDGSDPTKSSQKYTSPIILNESITLKAIAYANGTESKILKRDYQIVAHLSGEVFTYRTEEGVDMVLKAYMKSETDAYTYLQIGTGESGKTAINKNYSGKITVPAKVDGMVVQQIAEYAFDGCGLSSISLPADFAVMSFRFAPHSFRNCSNLREIRIPHCALVSTSAFENCNSLKKVIFSNIVIFNNSLSAAIQQNTASNVFSGCTGIKEIYANYDNPYPINDDVFPTNVYSDAILYVPNNATSKYKSTNGWKKFNNIVAIGSEPNKKLVLTASPSGGEVSKGTVIHLTAISDGSTVSGCDIYYTLNGAAPTKNSTPYTSSGITINSDCTLKAIAYKSGYEDSEVLTETYTIKETPKLKLVLSATPSGGQVSSGTKVTLTAKADGSIISGYDIYYTLNGDKPTTSSTPYTSSGITINSDCTLKAIAYKDGYETSDVLTATYTIKSTPKPKLVLSASPSGGQVSSGTKITLTAKADGSIVSGCDIYYTLNGNTPTNNSTPYTSSGITINSACTLKAIAYKDGFQTSDVLTASFTTRNGNTFDALTIEGVPVTYYIINEQDKTCQVGYGSNNAISKTTTGKITIPNKVNGYTVTRIAYRAFSGSNIESIIIPNTISAIGYLWDDVQLIPDEVFLACKKLAYITVEEGNKVYDSRQGCNAIIETSTNKLIVGSKYTIIPNNVVTIGDDAFGSREITTITIPYSVKEIGASAFNSSSLRTITIPNSVIKIGNNAFGYTPLTSITIPASVNVIESNLFVGCTSLNKIVVDTNNNIYDSRNDCNAIIETASNTLVCGCKSSTIPNTIVSIRESAFLNQNIPVVSIPNSIRSIGKRAFGCSPKTIISKIESPFKIEENVFESLGLSYNPYNESTLIVPKGKEKLYKSTEGWNKFKNIVESYKIVLTASPSGGEVKKGTIVKLTANVEDAEIYYALGDSPFYKYSSEDGILIHESGELYAYAHKEGFEDSDVLTATYTVKPDPKLYLSASPSSVKIIKGSTVLITVRTDESSDNLATQPSGDVKNVTVAQFNATAESTNIWYQLTGTITNLKDGDLYGNFDLVDKTGSVYIYGLLSEKGGEKKKFQELLAAKGIANGKVITIIGNRGSYNGKIEVKNAYFVSIDNSTISDCDIYYTLDGSTPSKSSTKYTSAGIAINEACTLKVIAYKDGYETSDVLTEVYTIKYDDIRLSIASSGFATFFSSESAYKLPSGLSAKVVKAASNGKLTYETIIFIDGSNGNIVPRSLPVMIESATEQEGTYTLTATESGATYTGTNLLRGSDEATTTTGDGYHYKLSYGPTGTKWDDVFGWYWGAQSGAPFQIEGHKAWLVVPKSGTRAAGFTIDGESVDIETVEQAPTTTDYYYDLQGRRITDMQNVRPSKKGVYIRNGQKVIVR